MSGNYFNDVLRWAVFGCLLISSAPTWSQSRVLSLSGEIWLERAEQKRRLVKEDQFRFGDVIHVKRGGRVIVVLGDRFLFELGSETRFRVDIPGGADDLIPPRTALESGTASVKTLDRPNESRDAPEMLVGPMQVTLLTTEFWASVTEQGSIACAIRGEILVNSLGAEAQQWAGRENCQFVSATQNESERRLQAEAQVETNSAAQQSEQQGSAQAGEDLPDQQPRAVQKTATVSETESSKTVDARPRRMLVLASSATQADADRIAARLADKPALTGQAVTIVPATVGQGKRYRVVVYSNSLSVRELREALQIPDIWEIRR